MWIYGVQQVKPRLSLSPAEGFLLDYWLFLHCDDTHPVWRARPIGSRFLASAGLSVAGDFQKSLLRVLSVELVDLSALSAYYPKPCPSEVPVSPGSLNLTASWKNWLQASLSSTFRSEFLERVIAAIQHAVLTQQYSALAFLLRRLAAELADDGMPPGSLVAMATAAFLESQQDADLRQRLEGAFLPKSRGEYLVRFGVTRVRLPRKVTRGTRTGGGTTRFVLTGDEGEPKELIGLQVRTKAQHPRQAAALAMPVVHYALRHLRLKHYVHTFLNGPVEVTAVEKPDFKETLHPPHPFWTMRTGLREIPTIPGDRNTIVAQLTPNGKASWDAATWHIAGALSRWSEDVHASASEVWQALESFAKGQQHVHTRLAASYLSRLPMGILTHLAMKVNSQQVSLLRHQSTCDWYWWDSKHKPVTEWARSIVLPTSRHFAGRWTNPIAPLILHEEGAGLVRPWYLAHARRTSVEWAKRRVSRDLDLLYALRNAAVHSGARIGNDQLAVYLGRLGLEVVFDEMAVLASNVLREIHNRGE